MAKVIAMLQTLRNNWKKTTVGICLVTWGGNWLYGKHCDNLLRRAACQEAQVWGNQIIPSNMQIKKATVFLNPAACKGFCSFTWRSLRSPRKSEKVFKIFPLIRNDTLGYAIYEDNGFLHEKVPLASHKARTLFEKNAAPILHLSGLDVTVVKTDHEGQAKKLLELMENTDMIVIAGGDGTVQEVITGLLRRADEAAFSKIPIGFIPLGKTSTLSHTLYTKNDNQVQCITDATLSILRGETVQLDVLQIKGNKEQPVFAVNGLRWGSYRDAGAKVSKYWYLGPMKIQAAHFFSTLKEWPQKHLASLTYLGPTPRPPEEPEQKTSRPPLYIRLYKRLAYYWTPTPKEIPKEEIPEAWNEMPLSALEFSVTTQNRNLDLKREEDFMNICIEPDAISRGDYVKRGSQKMKDPHLCPEGSQCLQASKCVLQLPEDTEGSLAIDSEEHEAMTVEVKLLPRKLHFFCDARKKVEMFQGVS